MTRLCAPLVFLLSVLSVLSVAPASLSADDDDIIRRISRTTLEKNSIESTPAGALALLEQLQPGSPFMRRVLAATAELDAADFFARRAAMRQLESERWLPTVTLAGIAKTASAEASWRISQLVERSEVKTAFLIRAAIAVLNTDPPPNCQSTAMTAARETTRLYVQRAARQLAIRLGEQLPEIPQPSIRGSLDGGTLMATGSLGNVMRLSAQGDELWRYRADSWSVEVVPSGNSLVASYSDNEVVELDAKGNTVWRFTGRNLGNLTSLAGTGSSLAGTGSSLAGTIVNPMRARPLAGGRVLIADYRGRRVLEINRQGRLLWQHETPTECFDAWRLEDGTTLFGCANLIRRVSPDHQTIIQHNISGKLNGIQALPNGNVLIANYGLARVVEIDAAGREVWRFGGDGQTSERPCDVWRLPTGNTLIATSKRVIEVTPSGEVASVLGAASCGCARK